VAPDRRLDRLQAAIDRWKSVADNSDDPIELRHALRESIASHERRLRREIVRLSGTSGERLFAAAERRIKLWDAVVAAGGSLEWTSDRATVEFRKANPDLAKTSDRTLRRDWAVIRTNSFGHG
jgi:hypothetical protein